MKQNDVDIMNNFMKGLSNQPIEQVESDTRSSKTYNAGDRHYPYAPSNQ